MIPCHYCGGTPELRHHRAEFTHFSDDSYMVVCKNCGARTTTHPDPETVKLWWDREYVMELVKEEKKMVRYIEIDGIRIEVSRCEDCPLLDKGSEDAVPWCRHPLSNKMVTIDVLENGRVADNCPLREVPQ